MNFLGGTVQDGKVFLPDLNRSIEAGVALPEAGKSVLVGVRPQHLTISDAGDDLTLDIRERLGGVSFDYLLTKDGGKITVESNSDEDIADGTKVTIDFAPEHTMFFDGETEQRLR